MKFKVKTPEASNRWPHDFQIKFEISFAHRAYHMHVVLKYCDCTTNQCTLILFMSAEIRLVLLLFSIKLEGVIGKETIRESICLTPKSKITANVNSYSTLHVKDNLYPLITENHFRKAIHSCSEVPKKK